MKETRLTAGDVRQSLNAHVASVGAGIRQRYGPRIGWAELQRILADRTCVRYPCEIRFESEKLDPGEFAYPEPQGARPEDGFVLYVHPHYQNSLDWVPYLVLYQLVLVNYGEFASPGDAEVFGAAALGLEREDYYHTLCQLADELTFNCPAG